MPVQRIGTDGNDTISVPRNELAGGTFDGAGGTDVLVLSGATDHEIFDLTTAALVTGFETIRGGSTYTETIRLLASQISGISTFESIGTFWADVIEIEGQAIDFRNKSFVGPCVVRLANADAHITVNSMAIALKVKGALRAQHLTIEGSVPTATELTAIHDNGIDFIHYIENGVAKTSTNFAPVVAGLSGDRVSVVAGQAVHLDAGFDVEVIDEQPLDYMYVMVDNSIHSGDKIDIDTASSVSLAPDPFGEDVFVDNVEIGTLTRADNDYIYFTFNENATADRVETLIKALTYKHDGPTLPAGQSTVTIRIIDQGRRSTEAKVTVQYPNDPPTDIGLDASTVYEDAFNRSIVGRLSSVDPNSGDTATYALVDDAGGRFELDAFNYVRVKNRSLLDYETAQAHTITVRVTDGGGLTFDKTFVITVLNSPIDDASDRLPSDENRTILGTSGNDVLSGGEGHNRIFAGAGSDMLDGKAGNDTLHGGVGNDMLTGGTGKDIFVFDTKPAKKTNADWIRDYNIGEDTIWLDNKVFTKLGKKGSEASPAKLNKKYFSLKGHKDKDDYLAYNRKTGDLTYDADGSGKKFKPVLIAGIDGDGKAVSALSAAEFYVV